MRKVDHKISVRVCCICCSLSRVFRSFFVAVKFANDTRTEGCLILVEICYRVNTIEILKDLF
jgi:hypothetical protein